MVLTAAELQTALIIAGWRCIECQSPLVRVDSTPLGLIPVVIHRRVDGDWCPATFGGAAAARVSWDLLDLLSAILMPYNGGPSYCDPVFHQRLRVPA